MKITLLFIIASYLLLFEASAMGWTRSSDTLLLYYFPLQCDSLIQANATNPDFVVMDVRTSNEYNPDHLEGAINRDYNSPDFNDRIDSLPSNKMYLLYCSGGSRSMNTFNLMISMGFTKLVDMLGGIYAWENESLPTTPDFAPLQMAVSDTVVSNDTVYTGMVDTIHLTVTNRANDILRFTGITSLAGTEFSTDFDLATTLEGPFDYTFSVYYTPVDDQPDSVIILLESNGGDIRFHIWRTGEFPASVSNNLQDVQWMIYPNPFSASATLAYEIPAEVRVELIVYNQFGQIVDEIVQQNVQKGRNRLTWDAEGLPSGVYFCRFIAGNQVATGKIVKL